MTLRRATASVTLGANLDSWYQRKTVPFKSGFTPSKPPSDDSWNFKMQACIYDSLGDEHTLAVYFRNTIHPETIRVYISIDGWDVNPPLSNNVVNPYTIKFNNGKYVPHDPTSPSLYYGEGPIMTTEGTLSKARTLSPLMPGDLIINGETISAPTQNMDIKSTSDSLLSSIAIAAAINFHSENHEVFAIANPTNLDLGTYTHNPLKPELINGMIAINNIWIIGHIDSLYPYASIVDLINHKTNETGVKAVVSNSKVTLTATDGRNIHLTHELASSGTFENFDMLSKESFEVVKTGTITLSRTVIMNTLTLTDLSGVGTLMGNNLLINNTRIKGLVYDVPSLISIINAHTDQTQVLAIQSGNDIILRSHQESAITLNTDSTMVSGGPTFSNFPLSNYHNSPSQLVSGLSDYSNCSNEPLMISGIAPSKVGLKSGILWGMVQTCSDRIVIDNWEGFANTFNPQTLSLNLNLTQYRSECFVFQCQTDDKIEDGFVHDKPIGKNETQSKPYLGLERSPVIFNSYKAPTVQETELELKNSHKQRDSKTWSRT